MKVLGFAGSLRKDSLNQLLLRSAARTPMLLARRRISGRFQALQKIH